MFSEFSLLGINQIGAEPLAAGRSHGVVGDQDRPALPLDWSDHQSPRNATITGLSIDCLARDSPAFGGLADGRVVHSGVCGGLLFHAVTIRHVVACVNILAADDSRANWTLGFFETARFPHPDDFRYSCGEFQNTSGHHAFRTYNRCIGDTKPTANGRQRIMTINEKLTDIRTKLEAMAVGACGVKWDCVVWRTSETGWIVGVEGVRKDAVVHTIGSAVDWFAWKRNLLATS